MNDIFNTYPLILAAIVLIPFVVSIYNVYFK